MGVKRYELSETMGLDCCCTATQGIPDGRCQQPLVRELVGSAIRRLLATCPGALWQVEERARASPSKLCRSSPHHHVRHHRNPGSAEWRPNGRLRRKNPVTILTRVRPWDADSEIPRVGEIEDAIDQVRKAVSTGRRSPDVRVHIIE